ncbi:MAG: cupin domain-containing protein [Croceivirga sp.]
MKRVSLALLFSFIMAWTLMAQEETYGSTEVYKIPNTLLAGEGLTLAKQKDPKSPTYQKKIFEGENIIIYMIAIGTGITNEFKSFPLEEFIFWINGKAVVEPNGEKSFDVHSGDYFVQAKGFNGRWNFIDNGGLHLELALIAKNRPDSTIKSTITKAKVFDRDMISGVTGNQEDFEVYYEGAELDVNILRAKEKVFQNLSQERLMHVLNGILTLVSKNGEEKQDFYPGDFFIIPKGYYGTWTSKSLQDLRVLEVLRSQKLP